MAAFAAAVLCASGTQGSVVEKKGMFLRQVTPRDSILIADHLRWGIALESVPEGTGFMFPDFSKGHGDTLVVMGGWQLDTVRTVKDAAKKKIYDIEASLLITSFEEGRWTLPPIPVLRVEADGQKVDTLLFEPVEMDIRTMPVDTATFVVHDIKNQIRYPLTFKEILPYLAGGWLFVVLVILIVCLLMMRKKNASGADLVKEPAHIAALRNLDKFRGNKYWAPDKQKLFYSGITDTLREYISARYGLSALESTTAEIFDDLGKTDVPADLYVELKELFETSDFVKFAKLTVPDEDNAKALPLAVRFVTSTYQTQIEEEEAAPATDGESKKEEV